MRREKHPFAADDWCVPDPERQACADDLRARMKHPFAADDCSAPDPEKQAYANKLRFAGESRFAPEVEEKIVRRVKLLKGRPFVRRACVLPPLSPATLGGGSKAEQGAA
eukprot:NODE_20150_length_810_cov_11.547584.p3 GENE.NODE_20150_length_810_cov_11.547584~~NODE_20150_length_810_cov_11.547584.p3  ORF type:complete len:109 (+),score=13.21 NODE_20150_length_810_cov_11.547584:314-640(+)